MTPDLASLRPALLRLHATLLEAERREREELTGPIPTGAWFGAALEDPDLAWLRPAARLVSAMDHAEAEARKSGVAPDVSVVRGWLDAVRAFTIPGPRYLELLQRDPDVILAHRDVVRALPPGEDRSMSDAKFEVHDEAGARRYEAKVEGGTAFLDYELRGGAIVLTHTEVPVAARKQGVGEALVRRALDDAGARGLTVVPLCPFVAAFIRRHPEYQHLVRG